MQSPIGLVSSNQEELTFFAPVFNLNEPYGFPEMPGMSFETVMLCEGDPTDIIWLFRSRV